MPEHALDHTARAPLARRAKLAQHGRLVVGVGSITGGTVLLGSNLMYLALAGATPMPWIPLLANVALIFGGLMFLRERRQRQSALRDGAPE